MNARPRKALLVDDTEDFTHLIRMAAPDEWDAVRAVDGEEGFKFALEQHPDVILMDVMMPNVAGVELLRRLQADDETRRIPVIVATGAHLDKSTFEMLGSEPNVASILKKPFSAMELIEHLNAAVSR